MSGISEQQLIEQCRQGDDEAFRELVDRHKRLVFALIARGVSNPARAEELSQEVFLRVYRGLPYFRGDARLSTWIFRIVSNVVSEERKPGIRPNSLDDPWPGSDAPPIDPAVVDRAYDDLELRDRLEKAIARLPAPYQLLINGHYLDGLRYEALASPLQLPMGTVKTNLHRAKRLTCDDANTFIEDLAAGDRVPDALGAHVAGCPRCSARLQLAQRIERTLAARPVAVPPAAFTHTVVGRIRHERWRAEQMLDLGFNVFVACGVVLIVAGIAGLVWASGLVVFSREAFSAFEVITQSTLTTVGGQARMFLFAGLLLTLTLAVWWWVEEEDATA